jgi:hypothetical protein
MGFKHIYIYDPSCRDCEIEAQMAEKYKNLERIHPSNSVITTQPTDYIPKKSGNGNTIGNSIVNDCVNGICNMFQKKKIDGGFKTKRKYKKGKTKRKYKKYKKGKTKRKLKNIKR